MRLGHVDSEPSVMKCMQDVGYRYARSEYEPIIEISHHGDVMPLKKKTSGCLGDALQNRRG
jgi:hypothetical protein